MIRYFNKNKSNVLIKLQIAHFEFKDREVKPKKTEAGIKLNRRG